MITHKMRNTGSSMSETYCNLSTVGAEAIARELPAVPTRRLVELDLSYNSIGEGAEALLAGATGLESLGLNEPAWTCQPAGAQQGSRPRDVAHAPEHEQQRFAGRGSESVPAARQAGDIRQRLSFGPSGCVWCSGGCRA